MSVDSDVWSVRASAGAGKARQDALSRKLRDVVHDSQPGLTLARVGPVHLSAFAASML